jgi:hypothetical protein
MGVSVSGDKTGFRVSPTRLLRLVVSGTGGILIGKTNRAVPDELPAINS